MITRKPSIHEEIVLALPLHAVVCVYTYEHVDV